MRVNVEIKARATSFAQQLTIAETLTDAPCEIIYQEDTFFNVTHGRLKLRVFEDQRGEVIFYDRVDDGRIRSSQYIISKTSDPETLKAALIFSLGSAGIIRKTRRLYRIGPTRIHLDEVEGLGQFIEFEYVLKEGEDRMRGEITVKDLIEKFHVTPADIIPNAYIDLAQP